MSKFLKYAALCAVSVLSMTLAAEAQDAAAGEKVFKKCQSCHAVGEGAKNKVGPQLNELFGRVAGSVEDYKYSKAMIAAGEEGLTWDVESLAEFLAAPKKMVKGTKMAFAGLKKDEDIANVTAYLATFSESHGEMDSAPEADAGSSAEAEPADRAEAAQETESAGMAESGPGAGAQFQLGRVATDEEVAAWDIDVRPDGLGLPEGRGTVAEGGVLFDEACASCHGDFGEGVDRWPVLAGGQGTLSDDRPVKTVGSYWPYLSTVYDYIHRAMPFGNARAYTPDEYYALTAYLLYLNDIVTEEDFELSKENFTSIHMPNEDGFFEDTRDQEAHIEENKDLCMTDCREGKAEITMHAAVLDVTPDSDEDSGGGAID